MFLETTGNSHNRLRESFTDFLEIPQKSMLSHCMATKHRCQLDSGVISLSSKHECLSSDKDKHHLIEKNNVTDDYEGKKIKSKRNYFSKIPGGHRKAHEIVLLIKSIGVVMTLMLILLK